MQVYETFVSDLSFLDYLVFSTSVRRFLTLEHFQLLAYVATRTKLIKFDVNYKEREVNKNVKLMTPSSYNLGQSYCNSKKQ